MKPFLLATLALISSLGAAANSIDDLRFGDPASEKAHALRGDSKRIEIKARVGTLERLHPARTLSGKGSTLEFEMQVAAADAPVLLEIQEIHNRRPDVFGYTVLVNDKEVYFRTYEEMGAGPNHYFIQCGRSLVPNGKLKVVIRSEGEAPFSLGRAWAYADFFALAEAEATYRKMPFCDDPGVLLGAPKYDPALHGPSEEEYTKGLWETLRSQFADTPYLPGSRSAVLYAFRSGDDVRQRIDAELNRAATWNFPSQMAFIGTEWGGHPFGMDGLGGYFGDVQYSAIRFDPKSGTLRTSWPESAGGVTWPTWNHPQLQEFIEHRLTQAARYYADRRAFLQARGQNPPTPLFCQEWGLSVPTLGDWNDATVAAAKRDGVTMTPGPRLDREEKFWIYKNLSEVPQRFSGIFRRAVGRESVVVDRGEVRLPQDQLADQYYFHTFYPAVQPLYDDQWAFWQNGVGEQTWTTGETGPHVPHAYYDYVIALGKLATVNLERGFFRDNLDFVHTLYELGFQWVTPCNSRPGDAARFLRPASEIDPKPAAPALHCEKKVLDVRFLRDEAFGPGEAVVAHENLTLEAGEPFEHLQLIDGSQPGRLVYRLSNQGRPFEGALTLSMIGRVADGEENDIEVAIGQSRESMETVGRLRSADFVAAPYWPWTRTARLQLGDRLQGRSEGYLQLVFRVKNKNTPGNARIEELRVSEAWKNSSGHPGGEPFTVKQRRTLRLWIQDRAVLERLSREYPEAAKAVSGLVAQGRYRSAYKALAGAISQELPARFAVRGHGKLGRYPLSIQLSGEDRVALVELTKAGPEFEFSLQTEGTQPCTVRLEEPGELVALGPNAYRIRKARGGGASSFDLTIQAPEPHRHKLPNRLVGVFAGGAPGGIYVETQEPGLWKENSIFVPVASDTKRSRVQDGTEGPVTRDPRPMDRVEITIDEAGVAREIRASFGAESGRIRKFYPPVLSGQTSNGIVELENGRRYELGNRLPAFTRFEVAGLKPNYRNNRAEDLEKALVPGMEVELTYCPYTFNDRLPRVITLKAKTP